MQINTMSAYAQIDHLKNHLNLLGEEPLLRQTEDGIYADVLMKRKRVLEISNYQKEELLRVFSFIANEYDECEASLAREVGDFSCITT